MLSLAFNGFSTRFPPPTPAQASPPQAWDRLSHRAMNGYCSQKQKAEGLTPGSTPWVSVLGMEIWVPGPPACLDVCKMPFISGTSALSWDHRVPAANI